jgi:hypothetical protein
MPSSSRSCIVVGTDDGVFGDHRRPVKDIPRAPPPSGTQIAALTSVVNLAASGRIDGAPGRGVNGGGAVNGNRNGVMSTDGPTNGNGATDGNGAGNRNGNGAGMNGDGNGGLTGGREPHRDSMSSMSSGESPFAGHRGMGQGPHGRDGPLPPPGGSRQPPQHMHALRDGHPGHLQHHSAQHGPREQGGGFHGDRGDRTQGGGDREAPRGQGGQGERRPPSPPFHDLTPSTFPPLHESRRRNAEQRADTLRRDHLIGEVEANRVFCRCASFAWFVSCCLWLMNDAIVFVPNGFNCVRIPVSVHIRGCSIGPSVSRGSASLSLSLFLC